MPIGLAGKTAIVTGAGRGIGKAVAEVFAREGARVLVVNRSPEAGQAATDGIVAEGLDASFLQADVRRKADMEHMAATCIERYGRIDILCLNAGIYPNADRRHERGDVGRRDGHQPQGRVLQADVRRKADMEHMAATCIERYGRIDILCLALLYLASERRHLSQRAHRRHERGDVGRRDGHQPQGRVLRGPGVPAADEESARRPAPRLRVSTWEPDCVSSITGPRVGLPDVSCYMASKGGVNAFVRGAALELAPYGSHRQHGTPPA